MSISIALPHIFTVFPLCIHYFLFKWRTPIILRRNDLNYQFSTNFLWFGSFFVFMITLIGLTLKSGLIFGAFSGLIYGFFTGKKIVKTPLAK